MKTLRKLRIIILSLSLMTLLGCGSEHSVSESSQNHGHGEESRHSEEGHHHEDENTHGEITLTIEPEQATRFGIEVETVTPGHFKEVIKTGGVIEPSASDVTIISANKRGTVMLADGMAEGVSVSSGERIATLSSDGLEGGDLSAAASVNLAAAKAEYERLKPLYESRLITIKEYNEAERAYKEAKALAGKTAMAGTVSLTSPVTGVITNLLVSNGQYVEAGQPVATVTKNARMTLRADLPSRYSSQVPLIESANFIPEGSQKIQSLENLGGVKMTGGFGLNKTPGYIPIYFTFNGNSIESPSGYATVYLLGRNRENVISVPRRAFLELQGNRYVYVVHDGEMYEKRLVTTGADDGERIEIISGLTPGEEVVVKGAAAVRMSEVSSVSPPAHTHTH